MEKNKHQIAEKMNPKDSPNSQFSILNSQLIHASVPFDTLTIDRNELYLLMGYGNQAPDKQYLDLIDRMLEELSGCCTPEYGYIVLPAKWVDKDHLQISDTIFKPGKIITASLREAEQIAVFVATVGKGFDQWNRKIQQGDDMVSAFFADSLGSVLAEACVAVLQERINRDMAEQGLYVSNSYSPGYCEWALVEQQKLFSFFPAQFCGVTLTESCLMLPIKTVSGIIGIGKNVKKRLYSCEVCTMTTCVKNRKKMNPKDSNVHARADL